MSAIDDIRARHAAATEGPWVYGSAGEDSDPPMTREEKVAWMASCVREEQPSRPGL
jgi:hypothetical protein